MSKTIAIIQARMGSSRFPNKTLVSVLGSTLLEHTLAGVRKSKCVDEVVVATSNADIDQLIVDFCKHHSIAFFRGSENDVLSRYRDCAEQFHASTIVRVTADCPLFDGALADDAITAVNNRLVDYATNVLPPTFPDGLDFSVFRRSLLEAAYTEADLPSEREHVVPWMWKHSSANENSRFKALHVVGDVDYSNLRWTVDYPEDLIIIQKLVKLKEQLKLSTIELADYASRNPDLFDRENAPVRDEGYLKSLTQDRNIKS